jgi:putative acetyltransferase
MINIRKYTESDAHAFANIYYNTIHTVNTRDYTEEQVNAWAPSTSVKDKVVGFAEFESNGHIDCFYVHHDYQGQAIGSALMTTIFNEAKKDNIIRIYAEVSITAKPFFTAKGFRVIKEQMVMIRGVELKNFVMEK